jgi:hypothetical protein
MLRRMKSTALLATYLVLSTFNSSVSAQRGAAGPRGYSEPIAFSLSRGSDGIDGRIQILEDARIQPSMLDAIRDAWGENPCAERPPKVLESLCDTPNRPPLRSALLRLLDERGTVIAERVAERPLADLSTMQLHDSTNQARRTYFFTVDLSAGAGSYSGPYTMLAEPTPSGLRWLTATDSLDTHSDTIRLVSTLKSGWRLVPRADRRGKDILMVRCRPDFSASTSTDPPSFQLIFDRFSFEGARWVRHTRIERGYWENEDSTSFPPRTKFP